jgi:prepilin-type processing-associated H-X9-DG protein
LLLSVMMASRAAVAMGRVPPILTMTAGMYPNDITATGSNYLFWDGHS